MADRVAARLRGLGVRRLPRRPHISTLDNPGHLTARELEVVSLLVADLSNADIAARLHISARTAAHHVSAIMAKLDASTRHAAARIARTWGAPSQPGPSRRRSPPTRAGAVPVTAVTGTAPPVASLRVSARVGRTC
jgi:DNA-binding CsgD family transcriptional regulator